MRISDWSSGVCSSDLHAPQWLRDTPSPLVTPQTMAEPYRTVDIPAFVERWLGRVPPEARATLEQWRETLEHALAESAPILVPNGRIRDIAGQWMAGSPAYDPAAIKTGRASSRKRVCQYVLTSVVDEPLQKKSTT